MGWWGKLLGGAFGFMLGGPLGALLGAAMGHNFDRGLNGVGHGPLPGGNQERIQTAFFTALFSTMGHLAKADGRVTDDEIDIARQIMAHMQLSPEQKQTAMHLFNEGKHPDFQLDDVMEQFRRECHRRHTLLQMFIEMLIATALADGVVHTQERTVLYRIADHLGFSHAQLDQLINMVAAQQQYAGGGQAAGTQTSMSDAYAVMGVSEDATDAEIKKAYRRLMNQHHPDKLVAKGMPEEMVKLATEKTQDIRAAYDQIKLVRKRS